MEVNSCMFFKAYMYGTVAVLQIFLLCYLFEMHGLAGIEQMGFAIVAMTSAFAFFALLNVSICFSYFILKIIDEHKPEDQREYADC